MKGVHALLSLEVNEKKGKEALSVFDHPFSRVVLQKYISVCLRVVIW